MNRGGGVGVAGGGEDINAFVEARELVNSIRQ